MAAQDAVLPSVVKYFPLLPVCVGRLTGAAAHFIPDVSAESAVSKYPLVPTPSLPTVSSAVPTSKSPLALIKVPCTAPATIVAARDADVAEELALVAADVADVCAEVALVAAAVAELEALVAEVAAAFADVEELDAEVAALEALVAALVALVAAAAAKAEMFT
jgi:hypothetical protein